MDAKGIVVQTGQANPCRANPDKRCPKLEKSVDLEQLHIRGGRDLVLLNGIEISIVIPSYDRGDFLRAQGDASRRAGLRGPKRAGGSPRRFGAELTGAVRADQKSPRPSASGGRTCAWRAPPRCGRALPRSRRTTTTEPYPVAPLAPAA